MPGLLKTKVRAKKGAVAALALRERRKKIAARVAKTGLKGKAAAKEVERRVEDVGGLDAPTPAPGAAKPRVASPPVTNPRSANRSEPWVARDLYLANELTPFKRGSLPPMAPSAAGIQRALLTHGEGSWSITLNPAAGSTAAVAVCVTPMCQHFGYVAQTNDIVAATLGGFDAGYSLGGTSYYVTNPTELKAGNAAGPNNAWSPLTYTKDIFPGTDTATHLSALIDNSITNVLQVGSVPSVSGMSPQKLCCDMQVSASLNATSNVYVLGPNSHPSLLGPGSGSWRTNDGDPTESFIKCNNPLLVTGYDTGSVVSNPNIYAKLTDYAVPDVLVGAGNHSEARYHLPCTGPSAGSWLTTHGKDYNVASTLYAFTDETLAWAGTDNATIPFTYLGEDKQNERTQYAPSSTGQMEAQYLRAMQERVAFCGVHLAQSVSGFIMVTATGGPVTVTLSYSGEYGIYTKIDDTIASLGEAPCSVDMMLPRHIIGYPGTGNSHQEARVDSLRQTVQQAADAGADIPEHVVKVAALAAANSTPIQPYSGLVRGVKNIGGKLLHALQVVPANVVTDVTRALAGERVANIVDKFVPKLKDLGGALRRFF